MRKYLQVFKTSWADGFVYRLNFIMWRVRSLVRLLAVFFLWLAILKSRSEIFGYDQSLLLTYILGTSVLSALVLGSRSQQIGSEIAQGDLSNYLLKPINYFLYWLSRDLADKLLNLFFVFIELALIIWLLKPPLVSLPNPSIIFTFIIISILAMLIYFFFSFLISSFTFWYPEYDGWPLRFFIFMIIEFLAGGLFPLDILPEFAFKIFRLLPPAYFLYYPMQIYLNRLSANELTAVISTMIFWFLALYLLARFVWRKGLKIYGAYGR